MKKLKYKVFLCVEDRTTVQYAYCECPIGLAQTCSHIGGLLFYLHHMHLTEVLKADSATSRPCQWNVPRPLKMDPMPLREWNLGRPKLTTEGELEYHERKQLDFDPRHPEERDFDSTHAMEHLMMLKKIFPKTGMSHLWTIPDETPNPSEEIEVKTTEDPLETSMKSLVLSEENLPIPVSIEESLSAYIEKRTRGQRTCDIWRDLQRGRITSSLFGLVLKSGKNPQSLVKQIINGSSLDRYQTLPSPVKWGVENEQNALKDYLALQNAITNLRVEGSGLTIYPSHAFLGATSDGWVYDESMPEGNERGVLEIKCPYSINSEVITDKEVHELVGREGFFLEDTDEGPRLRRDHKHYAQIQGEMAIMGCTWGDFVVWTAARQSNCFIERIYFDSDFCSLMMPKLVEFFVSRISSSYLKM
ncbi:uncharacterized protein LOC134271957 [Saccostrea cucullata]|uniref:uncharacterized protein LOC134271957 n=1 Tax=Saccostrea cuccullata TaxID=36930 RepID=UPI002ED0EB71